LAAGFAAICVSAFGERNWGFAEIHTERIAAGLILFAAFFDYADGFAARVLNASTELGKQLDSLSDMVTFGVAPGVLMASLPVYSPHVPEPLFFAALGSCALLPVAAAFRLARFNIEEMSRKGFIGIPTPATGIFVASFALARASAFYPVSELYRPLPLLVINAVLAALMVSKLPMMSLKPDLTRPSAFIVRLALTVGVVVAAALWGFAVAPFALLFYVLVSLVDARLGKR
jgi:CDP-diacylglycerol--serine O-phosphatidyltransferase